MQNSNRGRRKQSRKLVSEAAHEGGVPNMGGKVVSEGAHVVGESRVGYC